MVYSNNRIVLIKYLLCAIVFVSRFPEVEMQESLLIKEEVSQKQHAETFTVAYFMAKIETLKEEWQRKFESQESRISRLENEVEKLQSAASANKAKLNNLEEITKHTKARSCKELQHQSNSGLLKSGSYWIDPDGHGVGDKAIFVHCNMTTGTTVIGHNSEVSTNVTYCRNPGCYKRSIVYKASMKQINALIELSSHCKQSIKYDCLGAPFEFDGVVQSWWTDRHGNNQYDWTGTGTNTSMCACGKDKSCSDSQTSCNCNSMLKDVDYGLIEDRSILPVTRLNFGGVRGKPFFGRHTLGKLECSGSSYSPTKPASSCKDLWLAGETRNGPYLVQLSNGNNGSILTGTTICDMTKAPAITSISSILTTREAIVTAGEAVESVNKDERRGTVQQLTQQISPRMHSCVEIKNVTLFPTSGYYMIDPDGKDGQPPIEVYCNMDTGSTTIFHDRESFVVNASKPCYGIGCSQYDYFSYNTTQLDQAQVLSKQSQYCRQYLQFDCINAPINLYNDSLTYWSDSIGADRKLWSNFHSFGKNASELHSLSKVEVAKLLQRGVRVVRGPGWQSLWINPKTDNEEEGTVITRNNEHEALFVSVDWDNRQHGRYRMGSETSYENLHYDLQLAPHTTTCPCGRNQSCVDPSLRCNCDSTSGEGVKTDAGYLIDDQSTLPIVSLHLGRRVANVPTDFYQKVHVGPLECFPFDPIDSCAAVWTSVSKVSGPYNIRNLNSKDPYSSTQYCEMPDLNRSIQMCDNWNHLDVLSNVTTITSTNYQNKYSESRSGVTADYCQNTVIVACGKRIKITFFEFSTYPGDAVEIYDGPFTKENSRLLFHSGGRLPHDITTTIDSFTIRIRRKYWNDDYKYRNWQETHRYRWVLTYYAF